MITAIFCAAAFTYLMRFSSFFLMHKVPSIKSVFERKRIIAPMGPCLIAAIAATTLIPGFYKASLQGVGVMGIYILGLIGAWLGFRLSNNSGIAVISGILVYAIAYHFFA